ncbi:MAG: hypothetical protein AABW72_00135 [archaeon]
MAEITLTQVYNELKVLQKEIEIMRFALIPEEKIDAKELARLKKTMAEMESGKEKSFKEVFS